MKVKDSLRLVGTLAILFSATASFAQIIHEQSGVILPSQIDEMEILQRANGTFGEFAQAFDYKNDTDRIEVNIFKATYPNPSVWFPYAQDHLIKLLKPGNPQKSNDPSIAKVGSTSTNAIRQTYQFSNHYQSSSIAVVGFGDWMAFIMSTSKSLSPTEQKTRMDGILSEISVNRTINGNVPVTTIDRCQESAPTAPRTIESTQLISPISFEMSVVGGLAAQYANVDASGISKDGLTRAPQQFCREFSESKKTSWFRRKSEDLLRTWITPVSVTGMSVQGMLVPSPTEDDNENVVGTLIANNFERSSVVGFTANRPHPVYTQITAMSGLLESSKIASVAHKTSSIELVNQEE